MERDKAASQAIFERGRLRQNIRGSVEKSTKSSINGGVLRAHFVEWIVADNLPLSIAKSPSFRAFLQYINPDANQALPKSSITIQADLQ